MPQFLPTLRRTKAARLSPEVKAVLADYYASLWQYEAHRRARHWPIERAVVEGYERVIWVFKAVNTIAADQARLPFRLRVGGEGGEVLDDHPLYRVLNKLANPLETGQVFRKRLSAQILLSKQGAFVEKTLSNGGTIKRLDLLPPDRTELMPGSGDTLVDHVRLTRRDGSIRKIPWNRVLWFRDPHLLDPYSGVTPLEAAGMSVELDYFARLYNVSFMRNDGRPGGVLGVRNSNGTTTDMDTKAMDRIESRFGKGPTEAGKLSVIQGELSYIDLAARPRDMQYGQTSKNSKIELLAAFGVAESVLGYAADRTFANAEQELYNYWTITMPKHSDIVVSGFDEDSEDDLEGFLDTSKIEVLQRAEIARREEARKEFEMGLRSVWSYANVAGMADEIEETPHTRALYISQGKTPLPARAADAAALGLSQPAPSEPAPQRPELESGSGPEAGPGGVDVAVPPEPGGAPGPDPAQRPVSPPNGTTAPGTAPGAAAAALAAAASASTKRLHSVPGGKAAPPGGRVRLRIEREREHPELPAAADVAESDLDERARDRLEDTLAAALAALSTRWVERTIARLESPKARKGTRHWTPDGPLDTRIGTKAVDSARAVDEERWSEEAEVGTEPIIAAAAVAAAAALLADLGRGEDNAATVRGIVSEVVTAVVAIISRAAGRQAELLARIINDADQDGLDLPVIVARVRQYGGRLTAWAEGVATQAATATTNGARDSAAADIAASSSDEVTRTWLSRRDDKVRHSHHKADGQQQPIGQPFIVGDSLLRHPGDPLGSIRETAGCRCHLLHRSKRTGRFVTTPIAAAG